MYAEAAPLYLRKGWNTPLPLPAGFKDPPPDYLTGNYPEVDPNVVEALMQDDFHAEGNIGVRMPRVRRYEIIGIDVDQYEEKQGWETLLRIVQECGPLPSTVKSSSRGNDPEDPDSVSGIFYFRVPANKKWRGKLGVDIEVIQKTHRYAVVWPSTVGDRKYRWYRSAAIDNTDDMFECELLDEIPSVDEIPMLPERWQSKMIKGEAGRARDPAVQETEITTVTAARHWCAKNMPGWNERPSSEMHRATDPEALSVAMTGGAHDAMVSRIHRIVRLGAEGHHGLREGLKRIFRAFRDEVLGAIEDETARRSITDMREEFERSFIGEVVNLKRDVTDNLAMISPIGGYSADDVNTDVSGLQAQLRELARRRSRDVSIDKNNDRGRAKMLMEYWTGDLLPINGSGEWAQWDMLSNRLVRCSTADLYYACELAIEKPLEKASEEAYQRADALDAAGDPEAATVRKQAGELARRAQLAGQKSIMDAAIAIAHALPGPRVDLTEFDCNPMTLGVGNGVVDFTRWETIDNLGELLRNGTPEDRIFGNTGIDFDEFAVCPEWTSFLYTFLPDEDYRRFVQKVFGYCLLAQNPQRYIVFLQGRTSTGKTTIQDAVQAAIGKDYCDFIAANTLFREKSDAGPAPEMVKAMSRRIVFSSEIGMHNRLHSDVIKRVTGGRDQISARALYSNNVVSRVPLFTPVVATNSMPTITDGDEALWRRLLVLPFDRQVPSDTIPRTGIDQVKGGPEAVLLWLVEGVLLYLQEGLDPSTWPEICHVRGREFIVGTSDFQSFFHDMIEPRLGSRVGCAELYTAYKAWAAAGGVVGHDLLTARAFNLKMSANGVARKKTSSRRASSKTPRTQLVFLDVAYRKPDDTD